MEYIPYGRQCIDNDDIEAVISALRSDYLTTGPAIEEFEREICRATSAKYAVAISNGTAALHAACFVAGLEPGDEAITSPITFAASANCILYMDAKPVFADIDAMTYNINPARIETCITEHTKAIIPVYYTGQPCDMDAINEIAKKNNIPVIVDAAHALGSSYKGRPLGQHADMATLSFHPVKHITTGEGGAVITNNRDYYERLLLFRSHGITRGLDIMERNEGAWYYEQLELGYNYRMTDIQAALGASQLRKLDYFLDRRHRIVKAYNERLCHIPGITLPYQATGCENAWHLYVVQFDQEKLCKNRKEIFDALRADGIGVNVHYIPVYYHPYYARLGYQRRLCPCAEDLYERIISLPLWAGLGDEEVERVCNAVCRIVR